MCIVGGVLYICHARPSRPVRLSPWYDWPLAAAHTPDPTEHHDLGDDPQYAPVVAEILARMDAEEATVYNPDRGAKDPRACAQVATNGGFFGPWLEA